MTIRTYMHNGSLREYNTVMRWVVTHQKDEDTRTLTFQHQGRYTYATQEEAQEQLDACRDGLRRVIGDKVDTLRVLLVECYDNHFDPMGSIFSKGEHYEGD